MRGTLQVVLCVGMSLAGCVMAAQSTESNDTNAAAVVKKGIMIDVRGGEARKSAHSPAGQDRSSAPRSLNRAPVMGSSDQQISSSSEDSVQFLAGYRPIVRAIQQVPSVAAARNNVVSVYNSTGDTPAVLDSAGALITPHFFTTAFSSSSDGGHSWTSGVIPPVPGYLLTANIPYVAADRNGRFYVQTIGAPSTDPAPDPGAVFPTLTVQLNTSTDGVHWSDGIVVDADEGDDHTAFAVGRDPYMRERDNLYITWLSFHGVGSGAPVQLRFARSTDGGSTWAKATIAQDTPNSDPTLPQSVGDSAIAVDPSTGAVYVAYLNFSGSDQDFIRVLKSVDGGQSFTSVNVNVPGTAIPDGVPFVQPGHLCDCGRPGGGVRLIIHAGQNIGGGRFGLPRYQYASRIGVQPSIAAAGGRVYLVWSQSTSASFGDDSSRSNAMLLYSGDAGQTWTSPLQVNPTSTDLEHVIPVLLADAAPRSAAVFYYTEHVDGSLDVEAVDLPNGDGTAIRGSVRRVNSQSFLLPPSNNPAPTATRPFATLNYDFWSAPCVGLGTRFGAFSGNGQYHVVWADSRNYMTEPADATDPLAGQSHPQPDIYYRRIVKR